MIDVQTASELLDFSTRIGKGQRAQEQLEGAVSIHNLLASRGVAYLADEVGMGKTYVALGALALFRHYHSNFRVLIIAPRENIQTKWMRELHSFVNHNVRFADMRVKAIDGRPARPLVTCGNLLELVHEVTLNPNRDFFARLTSFSLPLSGKDIVDVDAARHLRDRLRKHLPWLSDEIFDLRSRQAFKDHYARAICCALPQFDLVIVDEGHNLKHGFGQHVSARNRVLALAMGHPDSQADAKLFPGFGPRAKRVLFLSATPVEETYQHLWNQLNIFGQSNPFDGLRKAELEEDRKKQIAAQFLIRRVTSIRSGGVDRTKNLYRREWRRGGVHVHDEPIRAKDARQRLIVALVQKKVGELLGHERFNSSFQIGMLASFESFLETTRLKRDELDAANFDDVEQTVDAMEREGIDVTDVNRLARSYRNKFKSEMPHPKMDALVESLADAWTRGRKALVFVRRVASVKELKRKLDERYDDWLRKRLLRDLPNELHGRLEAIFQRYQSEKLEATNSGKDVANSMPSPEQGNESDSGGSDTFFAWFFRGEGPRGIVSGANVQQRFIQRGAVYATFFEDNHVADLLDCRPGEVTPRLAAELGVDTDRLRIGLQARSMRYLSKAKKHARADRFEAVQAAAMEWLKDSKGPHQEHAQVIWDQRFKSSLRLRHATEAPDIGDWLELRTFFTELRQRPALRSRIWPESMDSEFIQRFRTQELRAHMVAAAARLGHAFIDLYVMTIRRLGSLEPRVHESAETQNTDIEGERIREYLDLLERQMQDGSGDREWGAFDELAEISAEFDLILDVNAAEARQSPLSETARALGHLLRQQQPVAGMSGQVNQTVVRQFRMPGYPLVLITTDLLQEGEDLHTFCSAVHHYGISWTPSSMEQRIGRIDRVRSQTERRLTPINDALSGDEMLQVYYPHLEDTVEVLQVQRVLERMNVFLRLMHEGLTTAAVEERSINAAQEILRDKRVVPQIATRLESAFPIRPDHLGDGRRRLAVSDKLSKELRDRFKQVTSIEVAGTKIVWESQMEPDALMGTAYFEGRKQPFTLLLGSMGSFPMIRCISPVGRVEPGEDQDSVVSSAAARSIRIGAIQSVEDRSYDLTVESDVLLASQETDSERVSMLIRRVVHEADTLEQTHLEGQDEELATFRKDLIAEGNDEQ